MKVCWIGRVYDWKSVRLEGCRIGMCDFMDYIGSIIFRIFSFKNTKINFHKTFQLVPMSKWWLPILRGRFAARWNEVPMVDFISWIIIAVIRLSERCMGFMQYAELQTAGLSAPPRPRLQLVTKKGTHLRPLSGSPLDSLPRVWCDHRHRSAPV